MQYQQNVPQHYYLLDTLVEYYKWTISVVNRILLCVLLQTTILVREPHIVE